MKREEKMWSDLQLLLIFIICAAPMVASWSPNDGHRRNKENFSPRQSTGYKSWNSDLYPIWKTGDSRWHDCWKGGPISLEVNNDAPTLTGAKATFYINLKFPQNQTVHVDGDIIWTENCTLNGTQITAGESVYPNNTWQNVDEKFPDGRPFPRIAKKKGSKFIFVWQTLGKYQQVVDGPSSLAVVDTTDVPLGSYTMEVTVYHYRGRQKFIPIGKANSQFTITDQIPFSVEISQISDLNDADNSFIQNRAILFGIKLHDPGLYLKDADISFSWDFGDGSGILISRVHTVTHTYLSTGVFKPHVFLQAAIPSTVCGTADPTPMISTITSDPSSPLPITRSSIVTSGPIVFPVTSEPTAQDATTALSATMFIPESEVTAMDANEVLMVVKRQAIEDPVADCLIYRYGTFSTTVNIVQGIESVEIVQISNVVPGSVAEMQQNAVDFTVTCQGSFPSEICTVVLDADCINPQQTDCSEVLPADECQLILRQFFNSSGTYCVNVSMTNAVSLAVASARVDVNPTADATPNTAEALVLVGMLLIATIIGVVAVTYRKYKEYAPLHQDPLRIHSEWIPDRAAVNIFLRNMFGHQQSKVSENSPLLHGCVI
ncbi:premelanosome protein a isoform X3 [Stegostoma tigrinum]|uniref:premelanosome protein a isoform X3 n=1 Tax=Stegostoma tigrinum TaxID=3053191 RepID=UPI00202B34D3|nr:premelanosome protein a isoform X3 [Stegostoma tigrinum]